MFAGIFLVYGILFTTGFWLYGNMPYAIVGTVISIISAYVLRKAWQKI